MTTLKQMLMAAIHKSLLLVYDPTMTEGVSSDFVLKNCSPYAKHCQLHLMLMRYVRSFAAMM